MGAWQTPITYCRSTRLPSPSSATRTCRRLASAPTTVAADRHLHRGHQPRARRPGRRCCASASSVPRPTAAARGTPRAATTRSRAAVQPARHWFYFLEYDSPRPAISRRCATVPRTSTSCSGWCRQDLRGQKTRTSSSAGSTGEPVRRACPPVGSPQCGSPASPRAIRSRRRRGGKAPADRRAGARGVGDELTFNSSCPACPASTSLHGPRRRGWPDIGERSNPSSNGYAGHDNLGTCACAKIGVSSPPHPCHPRHCAGRARG